MGKRSFYTKWKVEEQKKNEAIRAYFRLKRRRKADIALTFFIALILGASIMLYVSP